MESNNLQQSPQMTEIPLSSVGQNSQSAVGTHRQPSVRISRGSRSNTQHHAAVQDAQNTAQPQEASPKGFMSSMGSILRRKQAAPTDQSTYEYDSDTVNVLDVVDPEVSTLSTLTNAQNSLFVPQLGKMVNRQATYRLSDSPEEQRRVDTIKDTLKQLQVSAIDKLKNLRSPGVLERSNSITSYIKESRYAVLPHGVKLDGWSDQDKEELDDRVRHMLHSRRSRFKRSLRGFGQYVRRPLGLFITVYATLITLFGAAWVFFLIGWISLGSKRDYVINVVDNVLVALFAIIGDGLAPFRAVDTYHMFFIAKYHRKTWKRREQMNLPKLTDHNDLPDQRKEDVQAKELDLESLVARRMPRSIARRVAPRMPKKLAQHIMTRSRTNDPSMEYTVLTDEEQAKLEYHERKFSKSHTFYKPHETRTHYAFPLKLLVAIVILLDLHSCLQITLGVCTWSMENSRPFALTTVILCCSITCNITGGVLISIGDKRTRKNDVLERMMRQELTAEAIEKMETKWTKEAEQRGEINPRLRQQRQEEKEQQEHEQLKKEWKSVPLLPKKLLGKGEDHRQPSLPQHERQSNLKNKSSSSSSSLTTKTSRQTENAPLPPLREQVTSTSSQQFPGEPTQPETKGQKALRLFRRADMDQS